MLLFILPFCSQSAESVLEIIFYLRGFCIFAKDHRRLFRYEGVVVK